MKRGLILFLQGLTVFIGIWVLALILWEPHLEGRNVNATLFQIYFNDPFLAYAYLGSIAFFVGLYQVIKLLGYIGHHQTYSLNSIKALRTIKYCAITLIAFVIGAEAYIVIVMRRIEEDIAGGVAMGLFMIIVTTLVGATAVIFEKKVDRTLDIRKN
jgi:hypothetical protein